MSAEKIRSTTVLAVRRDGHVVIGGDGQVTMGNTIVKASARKIRRLADGKILAGFAGSAADGITLFEKFEARLKEYGGNLARAAVELAKDWRTDRVRPLAGRCWSPIAKKLLYRGRRRHHHRRRGAPAWRLRARRRRALLTRPRCRRASRREGAGDRRRDLHLHQRQPRGRGAVRGSCRRRR